MKKPTAKLADETRKALELVESKVPKDKRPESKLADVRAKLAIIDRELARGNELDKAIAAMQKATKELKTADAYAACSALLHQYPDLIGNARSEEDAFGRFARATGLGKDGSRGEAARRGRDRDGRAAKRYAGPMQREEQCAGRGGRDRAGSGRRRPLRSRRRLRPRALEATDRIRRQSASALVPAHAAHFRARQRCAGRRHKPQRNPADRGAHGPHPLAPSPSANRSMPSPSSPAKKSSSPPRPES